MLCPVEGPTVVVVVLPTSRAALAGDGVVARAGAGPRRFQRPSMLMSAMVRAVPPTVPKAKYDVLFAVLVPRVTRSAPVVPRILTASPVPAPRLIWMLGVAVVARLNVP